MFSLVSYQALKFSKIISSEDKKKDKKMINYLDYQGIKFLVSKKDYCRIERQNNICINVLYYENGLT